MKRERSRSVDTSKAEGDDNVDTDSSEVSIGGNVEVPLHVLSEIVSLATGFGIKISTLVVSYTLSDFASLHGMATTPIMNQDIELEEDNPQRPTFRVASIPSSSSLPRSACVVTVHVHEARGLAAADLINKKSDPYMRIQIANRKLDTRVVMSNVNPVWNEIFSFQISSPIYLNYVTLRVYDYDTFTNGTDLGRTMIPLMTSEHGKIDGWFPLMRKNRSQAVSGEIRISITLSKPGLVDSQRRKMEDAVRIKFRDHSISFLDGEQIRMLPGDAEKVEMQVKGVIMAVHGLRSRQGTLYLTNYRLLFWPGEKEEDKDSVSKFQYHPRAKRGFDTAIPYRLIERVAEVNAAALRVKTRMMEIRGRDFRKFNLILTNECDPKAINFHIILKRLVIHLHNNIPYARSMAAAARCNKAKNDSDTGDDGKLQSFSRIYNMEDEYRRQGFRKNSKFWRISRANEKYSLCSSYPKLLLVPKQATDELLESVGGYRSKGRIPVATWYHPRNNCVIARCAQPMVGLMGKQSKADQLLIEMLRASSDAPDRELLIYDCRSAVAAKANEILGKGSESTRYYTKCRIMQGNIPNIHVVRKSFLQLNEVCTRATHGSDESWLQKLAQTLWLQNLTLIISACTTCAYYIEQKKQSVLVHCSDGWDRTAQVCALTQVLMDSYYRTIEGIIVLIEKEWLSFGFKFKDRYGMCEKLQEKSPIFIQWLDCLHQVVIQFEHCFEYNTRFLFDIWIWSHSMWFGNFLGNSNKERLENRCAQKTISLWAMVEANKQRYVNPNYVRPSSSSASLASFPPDGGGAASKHVLMPISDWKIFKLWDVYLQHSDVFWASRGPWSATQISGTERRAPSTSKKSTVGNNVMWVPDEWSNTCKECRRMFTLVRRRHHCRACGHLFCARCTSNRLELRDLGYNKEQRVCNSCFEHRGGGVAME